MARSQLMKIMKDVVSLESEGSDGELVEETRLEVAEVVTEVTDAGDEVESIEDDIDELEESSDNLSAIATDIDAKVQDGEGISVESAAFVQHAVAAYAGRLGMDASTMLPSLESFGGDTGRLAATTVSLEGISEFIKTIYAAIKATVEKVAKFIVDFFAKVFGGVSKLTARINSLKTAIADIKSKNTAVESGVKIKVPSPNSLQFKGNVDASALKKGLENLKVINTDMMGKYIDASKAVYGEITKAIGQADKAPKVEAAEGAIAAATAKLKQLSDADLTDRVATGGKQLTLSNNDGGGVDIVKVTFGTASKVESFKGDAQIDPLNTTDMLQLLGNCESIVKSIEDSKGRVDDVVKARKTAVEAVGKIANEGDSNLAGKIWSKAKGQALLRLVQRNQLAPVTALVSYDFSTVRSVLAVVDASVKQYGKETKKDDKKDDDKK